MIKLVKHRFCNKCNSGVSKSDVKGYSFYCANCDEDLYKFETHKGKKTTIELCNQCSTEVELPTKLGVYACPNCGKPIINCSMCKKMNCSECKYANNNLENIIEKRSQYKDFYVLHYNVLTTDYLNKIEFMTYDEAKALYEQSKSFIVEDRVELIFAPADNDEVFADNIVMESKFTRRQ